MLFENRFIANAFGSKYFYCLYKHLNVQLWWFPCDIFRYVQHVLWSYSPPSLSPTPFPLVYLSLLLSSDPCLIERLYSFNYANNVMLCKYVNNVSRKNKQDESCEGKPSSAFLWLGSSGVRPVYGSFRRLELDCQILGVKWVCWRECFWADLTSQSWTQVKVDPNLTVGTEKTRRGQKVYQHGSRFWSFFWLLQPDSIVAPALHSAQMADLLLGRLTKHRWLCCSPRPFQSLDGW